VTIAEATAVSAARAVPSNRREAARAIAPLVVVVAVCAGAFGLLVVVFTDVGVGTAFTTFVQGAFGSVDATSETLTRAIPLTLVGVGAALALRAGVFNVGGEGQMAMGAVLAAIVARSIESWPAPIVWVLAAVGGVVGAALWAAVPAALWARRDVSEILSTLLMNFVATAFLAWLLANTFLHDPNPTVITPQGARLPEALSLPVLIDGSRLHAGVFVAVVAVAGAAWLSRSGTGFRIDLVGANPSLAAQAGLRPRRMRIAVLLASAGFAGIAGTVQLFGLSHQLTTGLTGGVGYTGLLVAVLGRGRPVPTAAAAVVFAALVTGGEALEREGVPRTLSAVIQAVLIVGVALATRTRSRAVP
jgi:general nucleoside transport system permease protein